MSVTYESVLTSEPFRVQGPDKAVFYVHGQLLSRYSNVLKCDVEGGMRESKEKFIHIKDVEGDIDDDTVLRFVEYVYTGNYTVSEPEPDITTIEAAKTEVASLEADDDWSVPRGKSSKHRRPYASRKPISQFDTTWSLTDVEPEPSHPRSLTMKEEAWKNFVSAACRSLRPKPPHSFVVISPNENEVEENKGGVEADVEGEAKEEAVEELEEVQGRIGGEERDEGIGQQAREGEFSPGNILLSHAQVYILAQRYMIDELKNLALGKLARMLSTYQVLNDRVLEIVELARYTYLHAVQQEEKPNENGCLADLPSLVVQFVVCHIEELVKNREFKAMLEESGPFAKDVIEKLMFRLN